MSRDERVNDGEPELKPSTYSHLHFCAMYVLSESSFEFLNVTTFGGGNDHFEDLSVNGRIILKRTFH
jgi:hypothetical protein